MDGARGGCRLDRAFDRWIGEVAAGERWCEPAKFSAGVDPAEVKVVEKYKDIRSLIGDYIAAKGEIVPEMATNWKFVK